VSSINESEAATLTPERLAEARLLVRHEFGGLDSHAQYFNAFARLLKADPLGRVAMLGTDQRDRFVPTIREALAARPQRPLAILDVGCGDGATFELFADAIPPGSRIDLVDPNADYVDAYAKRLAHRDDVLLGARHVAGFDPDPADTRYDPALGRGYDLILCLHSLYFFGDLGASMADLYARLSPGGVLIVVFADETVAHTGVCYRAYVERLDPTLADAHAAVCAERLALFEGGAGDAPGIAERLGSTRVAAVRQATRLFGHSIADLVALSNIAGLSGLEGVEKFDAALDLLACAPERLDFRIETDPAAPRLGMLSVQQPQVVCTIAKPA
jgi:SAM-dependent methyltransferase